MSSPSARTGPTEVKDGQSEQTTFADFDGDGVWHAVLLPQSALLFGGAALAV